MKPIFIGFFFVACAIGQIATNQVHNIAHSLAGPNAKPHEIIAIEDSIKAFTNQVKQHGPNKTNYTNFIEFHHARHPK